MFLAIDAGNSNVVFSFYKEGQWVYSYRMETKPFKKTAAIEMQLRLYFLEKGIKVSDISYVGISSVVPEITDSLIKTAKDLFGIQAHLVGPDSYEKLPVSTPNPQQMGTDLMCNVMSAYAKFKEACLIIDFGTALTFTVVSEGGAVLGVSIAPGLKTAIKALSGNTSKLPEVPLVLPESAIGKDTVHAIQAGILYGYTGLVEGMIQRIKAELSEELKVIATGGLSSILQPLASSFDLVDENLTVEGIRLITLHQEA